MRLIISDVLDLPIAEDGECRVIYNNGNIHHCIGCFGCWGKTPGRCVIKDGYENMGELMSRCSELILISRCTYGGFSPFVKNVLDRTISYASPHFEMRKGEMHHKRRYENVIGLTAYFYGENITENEKQTATDIVSANSINYDGKVNEVLFFNSADQVKEALA